ncbi:hypothetical protein QYE76_051262 [Lolium multiflorum]|uniref:Uncharacterized protein n=1 Tax=Lolium multiflorum TaxID=4521 RepID=A0AAD8SRK6_LOLMU|nr:hypothetical protein QYE76_051262 [Lolium multiflorum]
MAPEKLVIGIDLGTTNSCVGVWLNGHVEIVPSDQGTRTTPSCVAFTDSERLIGEGANHQVATNASNTVFDVKRLMGRSFSDASVKSAAKYWPFEVIKGCDNKPSIRVSYLREEKVFWPEEISAMVLAKMKETVEAYAGRPVTDAVITVPAYFNGTQRQATKDAGIIAGLNVVRIINEPTAAAIAYSSNTKMRPSTVLVYDLGGGKLDVSLVHLGKFRAGNFFELQVKATVGDTHLGGEDFTNNMVDHFVNEFKKKNPHMRGDIRGDKKAIGRLRRSCEEEKKRLSTNPHITVEIDALFEGIDFCSTLSRDKFEQLNSDLFLKCIDPIAKCLIEAKMDKNKVDDVVLVGGSTRIPKLSQQVQKFFNGKELCRNINADEAVAYGATVQAKRLMVHAEKLKLVHTSTSLPMVIDITPFSLGIGMLEGIMLEVIEKYTIIPLNKETAFVRVNNNKNPNVDITVYEDESAMAQKFCILLNHKNKVHFHIDQDGIQHISFSGEDMAWISLVKRFSSEEMKTMVENAQKYKAYDEEHKKNVQARNDIQNLLFTISNYMQNLEDSAAGKVLLVHPEATREQGNEPPVLQNYRFEDQAAEGHSRRKGKDLTPRRENLLLVGGNNKDQKDNVKVIQPHKKTVKKLMDQIKKLQEMADWTTNWIQTNELTTSAIIDQIQKIEDEYHSISSQIDPKKHIEGDYRNNKTRFHNNCLPRI